MSRRRNLIIRSDQFNFSAQELTDEADAEGDVGEFRLHGGAIVERECRPGPGMRSHRSLRPLMRMPHSVAVAIVDESLE